MPNKIQSQIDKLWRALCCFEENICTTIDTCLGINREGGDASLYLNQQGEWISAGSFNKSSYDLAASTDGIIRYAVNIQFQPNEIVTDGATGATATVVSDGGGGELLFTSVVAGVGGYFGNGNAITGNLGGDGTITQWGKILDWSNVGDQNVNYLSLTDSEYGLTSIISILNAPTTHDFGVYPDYGQGLVLTIEGTTFPGTTGLMMLPGGTPQIIIYGAFGGWMEFYTDTVLNTVNLRKFVSQY